jgi:hypothetical protein
MVDERIDNAGSSAPRPTIRDYADVGDRVAAILNAAEEAAMKIRADAERVAETTRRDADRETERYAHERRRQADGELERLVAGAAADAETIRATARYAAERIGEEGHRRLEELRGEARVLERRFESAVDGLRDLIAELQEAVLNAAEPRETSERPAEEARETEAPSRPVKQENLSEALHPASEREQVPRETGVSRETEEPTLDPPARSRDGERSTS